VPLETLVHPVEESAAPRFRKNLLPVSYVFGELSGSEESPVYALMALAYPGGFLAMIGEGYVRGVSLQSPWLPVGMLVFVAGKALKYWAIAALGPFWSFRVIVVPGAPRVVSGPYRWMTHPNYVGILGELLGVALMTLAWVTGPIAIAVFALLLWRRMAIENAALERLGPGAILRRG